MDGLGKMHIGYAKNGRTKTHSIDSNTRLIDSSFLRNTTAEIGPTTEK